MKMIKKIIFAFVIVFLFSVLNLQTSEAAQVNDSISLPYKTDNNITWSSYSGLALIETFWEDIFDSSTRIQVNLSKTFHFVKEDNSNAGLTPTLSIGKTLRAGTLNTTGYWGVFGNDSQWSGVKNKSFGNDSRVASMHDTSYTRGGRMWTYITTKVYLPDDNNHVQITSGNSNIVECTNSVCTAKSSGTTDITVSFPKITQTSYSEAQINLYKAKSGGYDTVSVTATPHSGQPDFFGGASAYGRIKFAAAAESTEQGGDERNVKTATYNFPSITYTVTVPPAPNQMQTVLCAGVGIPTESSVGIMWQYSDPENNPQTNYNVQISKNSTFPLTALDANIYAPANTNVSNVRSKTISGLTPDTTYYARVRAYNDTNLWSNPYSSCGSFKTAVSTTPPPPTPTPIDGVCNNSILYACSAGGSATNRTPTSWICPGLDGGNNSSTCNYSGAGLTDGVCNDNVLWGCENSGTAVNKDYGNNSWKCTGQSGGGLSGICTYNGGGNTFSITSCSPSPSSVNVGSSTTFTAIVSNAGTGGVNYSWKTLSMFNYSLPVLNDNSYLHTPSTITDKFVYVKAHDIQKNADSSYPCVVSVVDPSATVSCEAIDGITLNAGESRNFYTARISKICDPYLRTCPATGGAPQGNPLAKFKNCVEPGVSEF